MLETTIILQGKQAKQWTMMNMLDSMGAFDIPHGSVKINFSNGNVSFIEISRSFKTAEFSPPTA